MTSVIILKVESTETEQLHVLILHLYLVSVRKHLWFSKEIPELKGLLQILAFND